MENTQYKLLRNLLRRAKRAYEAASECQSDLFDCLRDLKIDPDTPVVIVDSANMIDDTLSEAIITYLLYDEIGEENLMQIINQSLTNGG